MRTLVWVAGLCLCFGSVTGVFAAEKPAKETKGKTCCEIAIAKGKECDHKCCVTAHRSGASCVKCNPAKEDLAAKKAAGKK